MNRTLTQHKGKPIIFGRKHWRSKPIYWRLLGWRGFLIVGLLVVLYHFAMTPEISNADFVGNVEEWAELNRN